MAMTIFLLLNGAGVAFLLFVLANVWKEGHRPRREAWRYAMEFRRGDGVNVVVASRPIDVQPAREDSVVAFRARSQSGGTPALTNPSTRTAATPVRRISTR